MNSRTLPTHLAAVVILLSWALSATAQDAAQPLELPKVEASSAAPYFTTEYIPPTNPKAKQLQIGVTYTLWIPPSVQQVRGIIVHQHGCGEGSCKGSVTAAHDLHWQELARRNNCALLGPSFHQAREQSCRLWCDPRNGSAEVFLNSLNKLADLSGHPEIATAPWCLWGHSGGGFWASLMQMAYPERIVAIWFQSGTAYGYWTKGEITAPQIPAAAMGIPMMANPGQKEKTDKRFHRAWDGNWAMFQAYRAQGAPIGFAPDPRTSHETGDSRYLAIPFFDACLHLRLPDQIGDSLQAVDVNQGWLTPVLSSENPKPAKDFKGDAANAVWLPNQAVAQAWRDFVTTGAVNDDTPPPAPTQVEVNRASGVITWKAVADFQSGIQAFIIERDGKPIGRVPEKSHSRFGRPLFQGMSYGDTPEMPLPAFRFVDTSAPKGASHDYRVIAVNSAGLRSQ